MANPDRLRPEVTDVLRQLRSRIRRYVAIEGLAIVLVVLGLAFWFSLGADYWLELSRTTRQGLLVVALGLVAAAFVWFLLLRIVRNFRDRALALVLERRFPELNDRLITAVELVGSRDVPVTPLGAAMLRQTAEEAAELSHKLQLREVFNLRPLLKVTTLAVGLGISIFAFVLAGGDVFHTWFRRNLLMGDEFYRRETDLTVVVLADPGERVVEFRNGIYKHPRGADLTLLATVPDDKTVPQHVDFYFRNIEHSGGGRDTMTKIGQRQFRQRLGGLHESIRLWLSGGDYSTRTPLIIEVVEPPQVDQLVLRTLYPDYTGLNLRDDSTTTPVRQDVPVLGTQVSIPAGSDFLLDARTNKPLLSVRIQSDLWELRLEKDKSQFRAGLEGDANRPWLDVSAAEPMLSVDGQGLRIPCVLSVLAAPELVSASGGPVVPFPVAPDSPLRITLHDSDDIISAEPARLVINSIPDEPPRIETRLKGIGTSITRQATIPLIGEIQDPQDGSKRYGVTDDYGIAEARFEYRVEAPKSQSVESTFKPSPLAAAPGGTKAFPLEEKFHVLPLDLTVGVRLTLKVVAVDSDNLTGPHVASGQPYSFQVVSDDELLALIAVKELNLRRRFEQILDEVKTTRKDLLLNRTRLEESRGKPAAPVDPASEYSENRAPGTAVLTAIERAINAVRKNQNETLSIEEEFRDIRDELENNSVPDVKPMLERLDDGIIRPLHSVNTVDYNGVDEALVLLRQALEEGDPGGTGSSSG